ncbi:hypothetical protein ACA910_013490 [Epithemia clementina (nom. ined.)]
MLDMGGAPSAFTEKNSKTRIDVSKNSKVQAVAFDFHVLTTSLDASKQNYAELSTAAASSKTIPQPESGVKLGKVLPDINVVQEVANLLQVNLGGVSVAGGEKSPTQEDDDLSLLTGEKKQNHDAEKRDPLKQFTGLNNDVRSKYADKLKQRGLGSINGVDIAKSQVEETLKRGDAGGHLAARKLAVSEPPASGTRWIAPTGTGSLLQYMTQRCIKICLLPKPLESSASADNEEGGRMEDLTRQLKDVVFDVLLKDGRVGPAVVVNQALERLKLNPSLVLLVSDRDDYLKAAKEAGMITCRIRPANTRRGNITAQYMIPSIPEVRSVIDDINGISFNAVLKER